MMVRDPKSLKTLDDFLAEEGLLDDVNHEMTLRNKTAQHTAPEAIRDLASQAISEVRHKYIDYDLKRVKVMAIDLLLAEAAIAAISGQIREAALREAAVEVLCQPQDRDGHISAVDAQLAVLALIEGANHANPA